MEVPEMYSTLFVGQIQVRQPYPCYVQEQGEEKVPQHLTLVTSGPGTHCHDHGKGHALDEQNTWKKCTACKAVAGRSSWTGRSCSSQKEGRGIWQGGEGEEKEDSTLAVTHLWLLGSSTWPIYKHVDF